MRKSNPSLVSNYHYFNMEIQIPYSIIFFTFFFFILVIHKFSFSKKPIKTLPPGPRKLPLIGNLHQLVGSLPHRSLANLANKYGPFIHLQLGQLSHIIVSSPEYAKEIMKTHDQIFANRPTFLASETFCYNNTDIAFSPYGNYWRQLRKICTLELLSAKRVRSFRKIREEEVSALVRNISEEHEGSVMNLSPKLFALTNSIVARAAFGKKTKNVEHILQTVGQVIKLSSGLSVSDFYPSLKFLSVITGMRARTMKVHRDCDRVLGDIIRDHKEKKANNIGEIEEEDLVDVLLRIQEDNDFEIPLSLDNIKAVLMDVFIAGTDTTATTTEWAMSELLKNPELMKEAQEEVRRVFGGQGYVDESKLHQLKYLGALIKETLRLHPPTVLLIPRENSESCEIKGYVIPSKTRIMINAWAIGRDPNNWNEPERFEPKRFLIGTSADCNFKGLNFEYIPFGAGRRMCPGITFATPVLELLLSNLLYHFDWKLSKGIKPGDLDMDESFGSVVKRKNDLIVVPVGYSPY